jgi:inhibitor of cysteine peptidase
MKSILCGWLLLCSMWGNAADTMTINVAANSPQFVVNLPANPTTGYRWSLVRYDKNSVQLIGSNYQAPKTKLIGAGGTMTFTFAPIKGKSYPSSTKMAFKYARPWEPASGSVKNVVVNFKK